ncbi:MAG: ABC transporter ATP-binding protein [Alphaproteobacteria bacterium]
MSDVALELQGVAHRYGKLEAVRGVSFQLKPESVTCLLGPSGCGKTTILRLIAGLEDIQVGDILIKGQSVVNSKGALVPPERRGVGIVFQDYALFPHLSVRDNIAFGLPPGPDRSNRVSAALEAVHMQDYAIAFPHMLSGGQQQRVALARALAPRPTVLLLDEPFSGLDRALRARVRDQTLHILKQSGIATLIVTHDPEEAMFMADHLAVMREGRIVQQGTPTELYFHPIDPFVAGFLGEINDLSGQVVAGNVATPFGVVPAMNLAEGTQVRILIRPEALRLTAITGEPPTGDACQGRIVAARFLGRTSLLHLDIEGIMGMRAHMHARTSGSFLPQEGTRVEITVDRQQIFIFPAAHPI